MTAQLADIPTLTTERLTLRAPRMEDFKAWVPFYASPRAVHIGGPLDLGHAWRAFAHVAGQWALRGYGSFIFCLRGTDAAIGMSGPWHPADWPEREIGSTTAVSYIEAGNTRSIALAERLGATRDPQAIAPYDNDPDTLVYRHPAPEAL